MKARKFPEAQKAFILNQALMACRRQTSEVLARRNLRSEGLSRPSKQTLERIPI